MIYTQMPHQTFDRALDSPTVKKTLSKNRSVSIIKIKDRVGKFYRKLT